MRVARIDALATLTMSGAKGIVYSVVARNATILAEYNPIQGNISQTVIDLLSKIQLAEGQRSSYTVQEFEIHILSKDGLNFVCVASSVRRMLKGEIGKILFLLYPIVTNRTVWCLVLRKRLSSRVWCAGVWTSTAVCLLERLPRQIFRCPQRCGSHRVGVRTRRRVCPCARRKSGALL